MIRILFPYITAHIVLSVTAWILIEKTNNWVDNTTFRDKVRTCLLLPAIIPILFVAMILDDIGLFD